MHISVGRWGGEVGVLEVRRRDCWARTSLHQAATGLPTHTHGNCNVRGNDSWRELGFCGSLWAADRVSLPAERVVPGDPSSRIPSCIRAAVLGACLAKPAASDLSPHAHQGALLFQDHPTLKSLG